MTRVPVGDAEKPIQGEAMCSQGQGWGTCSLPELEEAGRTLPEPPEEAALPPP